MQVHVQTPEMVSLTFVIVKSVTLEIIVKYLTHVTTTNVKTVLQHNQLEIHVFAYVQVDIQELIVKHITHVTITNVKMEPQLNRL